MSTATKIVFVVIIIGAYLVFIQKRKKESSSSPNSTGNGPINVSTAPTTPIQPAPSPAPAPVPIPTPTITPRSPIKREASIGDRPTKAAIKAKSVRVQSTKKPPHIDGIVNMDAIFAYYKGTAIPIVAGAVVPYNNDPNLQWTSALAVGGNLTWTAGNAVGFDEYISFDFGAAREIDEIIVANRTDDPWKQRAKNYSLILFDENTKEVWRQDFGDAIKDSYRFTIQ